MSRDFTRVEFIETVPHWFMIIAYSVLLAYQFYAETTVQYVGLIKYWFHRLCVPMVLLQLARSIDPYSFWNIMPQTVQVFIQANNTVVILTAATLFISSTVSVLYRHDMRDPPPFLKNLCVYVFIFGLFLANGSYALAVVYDRNWITGVYLSWIAFTVALVILVTEVSVYRLLDSLQSFGRQQRKRDPDKPIRVSVAQLKTVTQLRRLFAMLFIAGLGTIGFTLFIGVTRMLDADEELLVTRRRGFDISECVFAWLQWVFMWIFLWLSWVQVPTAVTSRPYGRLRGEPG